MNRDKIFAEINNTSENLLLHYASPNQSLVSEVLRFDAESFNELPDDMLSKYILAMGQYLVMLQHNENLKAIDFMIASRVFENKINMKTFQLGSETKATLKERRAALLESDPDLIQLQDTVVSAEAQKMLLVGTVRASEGLLNALKKEKSSRDTHA